jgi:hypothetical protein
MAECYAVAACYKMAVVRHQNDQGSDASPSLMASQASKSEVHCTILAAAQANMGNLQCQFLDVTLKVGLMRDITQRRKALLVQDIPPCIGRHEMPDMPSRQICLDGKWRSALTS